MITATRLVLVIPVALIISSRHDYLLAAALLGAMGLTDFLDGYVARRIHAVTTFGKVFDPLSDRVVLIAIAAISILYQLVPGWLIAVILVREILVGLTVGADLLLNRHRNEVVWIGKAGTFGLLAGFPLVVMADGLRLAIFRDAALAAICIATALLYGALWLYLSNLMRGLRRARL